MAQHYTDAQIRAIKARAWNEGHKQGGLMCDEPQTGNPYLTDLDRLEAEIKRIYLPVGVDIPATVAVHLWNLGYRQNV